MNRLAVLLLTACFALPACSAENTNEPAATAPAQSSTAQAAAAQQPEPVRVAQADTPTPAETTESESETAPANKPQVSAPAERADLVEGRHYRVLKPAQPTSSSPDKVEVAEMFMYMCPHCYSFEPFVDSYLKNKPAYVSFVRIPASFNKTARLHAKAFYAAELLGVLDDVHLEFFRAYHTDNRKLDDNRELLDFFADHGVDRDMAEQTLTSFAVDTKLRHADTMMRRYRIESVPTLVINGKYVTSAAMAGSSSKLREIVDYLVAREAAEL